MELNIFHISQFSTCQVPQSEPVACTFPRIGVNEIKFANTASRNNDRLSLEKNRPARFTEIAVSTRNFIPVFKKRVNSTFHMNINTGMNTFVLQSTDQFKS